MNDGVTKDGWCSKAVLRYAVIHRLLRTDGGGVRKRVEMPVFRSVKPSEYEECLDLWEKVFAPVPRSLFAPYFYGDPWYRRAYTRVCEEDGKLVSAVQVVERKVYVGSAELIMGGIACVVTDPDYRGRGYNTQCLRDIIRVMKRHGMDFSVLFTGIRDFYGRLGWRSVPTKIFSGAIRHDLDGDSTGYVVRACDFSTDLPALEESHKSFSGGRAYTTARTPEYWQGYVVPRFGPQEDTLVAEYNGSVVGYLLANSNGENSSIGELGYLAAHGRCIGPLMHSNAVRMRDRGVKTIHAYVPEEPAVLSAFQDVIDDFKVTESRGGMCLVTNMTSLGRRLMPELNRRARESNPLSGAVSLDTEMGSLALTVEKGEVVQGARKPTRVPMSQPDFFCLLLGIKSIEELGIETTSEATEIISALFPRQRPAFWLPDHF